DRVPRSLPVSEQLGFSRCETYAILALAQNCLCQFWAYTLDCRQASDESPLAHRPIQVRSFCTIWLVGVAFNHQLAQYLYGLVVIFCIAQTTRRKLQRVVCLEPATPI